MTQPAGWYDDGSASGTERWFDGLGWTHHRRPAEPPWAVPRHPQLALADHPGSVPSPQWPAEQPSAIGSDPSDVVHWVLPVGRSWQSIAAGYLGLFGLVLWVFAPFALWLGLWAMRRAKDGGHGRGRAGFAVIAGSIGTTALVLFVVGAAVLN